jgi:predicted component of type VI protein secretion system
MARGESIHQKLSRVRKPHVHITYEVEKGDALEVKELCRRHGAAGPGRPEVRRD